MKHTCHWEGCEKECPPAMWGCKEHWFTLPIFLRGQIWRAYVPGQEITKTPSQRYLIVARLTQEWIKQFKLGKKMNEQEFLKHLGVEKKEENE